MADEDLIQVKHKDSEATTTVPRSAFEALWKGKGFVEVKADEALTIHDVAPDTGDAKQPARKTAAAPAGGAQ
jgi:hypothetical protein